MGYKLFFDTETTGLPLEQSFRTLYAPQQYNYYNQARLIELAYIITDDGGQVIKRVANLVKPAGFTIRNKHIHGISHREACQKGYDIRLVLSALYLDLCEVDMIVAHNLNFDIHILLAECCRFGFIGLIQILNKKRYICTMKLGQKVTQFNKAPKLTELYYLLFRKNWQQIHRALDDTQTCAICYFELLRRIKNNEVEE